jgi:transposase
MIKYSFLDFQEQFPNEEACLDFIFKNRYPNLKGYTRIKKRKAYQDSNGKQIYPLKGTILEKSDTKLVKWLHAIYLFSTHKNGVSAKTLEREVKVTYKTAWRMAHQIRKLMEADADLLSGTVEADETYVGGYRKGGHGGKGKTPVLGIVQRGGGVRVKVSPREVHLVLEHMKKNIKKGSKIYTDQFGVYRKAVKLGYEHGAVNHYKKEFARGNAHTNTIEGFWSQLKRSLNGTYHSVSPEYLQAYVNEFAFRYSFRGQPIFETLLRRI